MGERLWGSCHLLPHTGTRQQAAPSKRDELAEYIKVRTPEIPGPRSTRDIWETSPSCAGISGIAAVPDLFPRDIRGGCLFPARVFSCPPHASKHPPPPCGVPKGAAGSLQAATQRCWTAPYPARSSAAPQHACQCPPPAVPVAQRFPRGFTLILAAWLRCSAKSRCTARPSAAPHSSNRRQSNAAITTPAGPATARTYRARGQAPPARRRLPALPSGALSRSPRSPADASERCLSPAIPSPGHGASPTAQVKAVAALPVLTNPWFHRRRWPGWIHPRLPTPH